MMKPTPHIFSSCCFSMKKSTTTYFYRRQYVNINSFFQIFPYFLVSCPLFVRMCDFLFTSVLDSKGKRPGWERHAMALACTHTCHIKNTCVVCRTSKTSYSVLSHLLMVLSFSTLVITLFNDAIIINACSIYVKLFSYFCSFI